MSKYIYCPLLRALPFCPFAFLVRLRCVSRYCRPFIRLLPTCTSAIGPRETSHSALLFLQSKRNVAISSALKQSRRVDVFECQFRRWQSLETSFKRKSTKTNREPRVDTARGSLKRTTLSEKARAQIMVLNFHQERAGRSESSPFN